MLYPYRCTEQQLADALVQLEEAGDRLEHIVFKGGRDYMLIVRKASEPLVYVDKSRGQWTTTPGAGTTPSRLEETLTALRDTLEGLEAAVERGARAGMRRGDEGTSGVTV